MNLGGKTPPKRVIEISALTCLPKLLNRDDVTAKYEKVLEDVRLAEVLRRNPDSKLARRVLSKYRQKDTDVLLLPDH